MKSNRSLKRFSKGFTLLEIVVAVAIVGILAVAGMFAYQKYVSRAQGSEIAVKYDAIRTNVRTNIAEGTADDCAAVARKFDTRNLPEQYATLSYGFEAVPGGFRPVLSVCATAGKHGEVGVKATRAAHDDLAKNGVVEKGAVVSDSVVSFALRLTANEAAICKMYTKPATGDCTGAPTAGAGKSAAALPATAAQTAQPPAQAAATPATPACAPTTTAQQTKVPRQVMTFDPTRTGYIMNTGDLNTGGDLKAFSFEVAVMGGQQVANEGVHGATMLSYATKTDSNAFILWNPASVSIDYGGRTYNTGLNTTDGVDHRLTVTWSSATGALTLYDNGVQKWTGTAVQGGSLGGNGKLVLAQDQDSYGGGFDPKDAYQGRIVAASMARQALSTSQVASGPVQAYLSAAQGLVTSVVAPTQAGQAPIDVTGRHTYTQGGSVRFTTEMVDRTLYVTSSCN